MSSTPPTDSRLGEQQLAEWAAERAAIEAAERERTAEVEAAARVARERPAAQAAH